MIWWFEAAVDAMTSVAARDTGHGPASLRYYNQVGVLGIILWPEVSDHKTI